MTEEQLNKLMKYIQERKWFHSQVQQHTKDVSSHVGAVTELVLLENYLLRLLDK